jgi:hypothetical protein
MATSHRSISLVALFLVGSFGPISLHGQDQSGRADDGRDPSVQTSMAALKQAEIVLLDDGRIVSGVLSEEDSVLIVTQPIGAMRFPKKKVEKVFGSIREVYRYKLERLAENDTDERLKLARWCLRQKMEAEAREQLEAILRLNSKHTEAKAMLVSLDQVRARLTMRSRDPEVKQTAAEQVGPVEKGRPGSLDASIIYGATRGMGISDLPVIFDLPPSQAVKRADQFARYVHPVLQAYCARCHHERYDGDFQLVQVKNKHDRTKESLRANLDATLKLIDRENPRRSQLLASSLLPHGRGLNPRPIFQGSNDKAYQILAAWVNSLQARKVVDAGVAAARTPAPGSDAGEEFAAQRSRIGREAADPAGSLPSPTRELPLDVTVMPPVRYEQGKGLAVEGPSDPNEFPVPFAISGKKPPVPAPTRQGSAGDAPARGATKASATNAEGAANAKASSGQAVAPPALPPGSDAVPAAINDPTEDKTGKKPSKKLKIDPSILQRALQLRNQNR